MCTCVLALMVSSFYNDAIRTYKENNMFICNIAIYTVALKIIQGVHKKCIISIGIRNAIGMAKYIQVDKLYLKAFQLLYLNKIKYD